VKTALEQAKGNKAEAARILGVQRRLLYEKMSEIGLRLEEGNANK
jgi:DNA-binding NtrC family response regulator